MIVRTAVASDIRPIIAGIQDFVSTTSYATEPLNVEHVDATLRTLVTLDDGLVAVLENDAGDFCGAFVGLAHAHLFSGRRKSGPWTMGAEPLGGWDAVNFAINAGRQIVGGSDGNLYELVADQYTESGAGIVREATSTQVSHDGRRAFMSRLELDIEAGVGLVSGQGSNPLVMAAWSDDGGKTWTNPRTAQMGPAGHNRFRAVWHACGSYRNRIIRFRVSDPVKTVFLGAWADVQVGNT